MLIPLRGMLQRLRPAVDNSCTYRSKTGGQTEFKEATSYNHLKSSTTCVNGDFLRQKGREMRSPNNEFDPMPFCCQLRELCYKARPQ
jgi:hypothetical protein